MTRVVIESPLDDITRELVEENKRYARKCIVDCLRRGEAPYASHLFFDHPEILDDLKPEEREVGLVAGLAWGMMADKVAVYTDRGISKGMLRGIAHYEINGIPVEYRTLPNA
jgi:hypothetical protein